MHVFYLCKVTLDKFFMIPFNNAYEINQCGPGQYQLS